MGILGSDIHPPTSTSTTLAIRHIGEHYN